MSISGSCVLHRAASRPMETECAQDEPKRQKTREAVKELEGPPASMLVNFRKFTGMILSDCIDSSAQQLNEGKVNTKLLKEMIENLDDLLRAWTFDKGEEEEVYEVFENVDEMEEDF